MPAVKQPAKLTTQQQLDELLDAFADFDENRNRSVRDTLARVKAIANSRSGSGDEADDGE